MRGAPIHTGVPRCLSACVCGRTSAIRRQLPQRPQSSPARTSHVATVPGLFFFGPLLDCETFIRRSCLVIVLFFKPAMPNVIQFACFLKSKEKIVDEPSEGKTIAAEDDRVIFMRQL